MADALIGFVLLVSPCGHDACDALPVTEDIYPTRLECQRMIDRLHQRRPNVVLFCGEVYRDESEKPR
ncbi:hypothetical protein [Edwardsiella piscicida]|uniref:hypothetical protein n=1 Tax=Edwardsiella piscicida TaxID=1263550 RepID=UPI0009BABEE0|nr:hypothetical protein [Edwardsiella piscicida]ARD19783.1 hypothetical protein BXA22_16185 [Edwardsiella piscicida]WLJ45242.1 hypothetical protein Q8A59_09150 [Edwardsiella piscicida]